MTLCKMKWVTLLILLVAAIAHVAANGQSQQPGSAKSITLTFGNFWTPDAKGNKDYHTALVSAWMKQHAGVKVQLETYGSTYFTQVAPTWLASNTWPNGFIINTDLLRTAVKSNQLMDWTQVLNADPTWKDSFLSGILKNEDVVGGKYWGVPNAFITNQLFFYNKSILAKAGYRQFPRTWGDMLTMLAKLKRMGYVPIAMWDTQGGWPVVAYFLEPLVQFVCGTQWVDEIGSFSASASYTNPCFVRALSMIDNLAQKGYFNKDFLSANYGDNSGLYGSGKAATLIDGTWMVGTLIQTVPKDVIAETEVAPLPRPSDSSPNVPYGMFTGGAGWAYSGRADLSGAKKQDLVSLVKYLTGPAQVSAGLKHYDIPPTKLPPSLNTSELPRLEISTMKVYGSAPAIYPMNEEQNGPTMPNVLYRDLQSMLAGSTTPEETAHEIEAAYNRLVVAKE